MVCLNILEAKLLDLFFIWLVFIFCLTSILSHLHSVLPMILMVFHLVLPPSCLTDHGCCMLTPECSLTDWELFRSWTQSRIQFLTYKDWSVLLHLTPSQSSILTHLTHLTHPTLVVHVAKPTAGFKNLFRFNLPAVFDLFSCIFRPLQYFLEHLCYFYPKSSQTSVCLGFTDLSGAIIDHCLNKEIRELICRAESYCCNKILKGLY